MAAALHQYHYKMLAVDQPLSECALHRILRAMHYGLTAWYVVTFVYNALRVRRDHHKRNLNGSTSSAMALWVLTHVVMVPDKS